MLLERIRAEKERLIKEGKIKKPKKTKTACDKPRYPFELPKGWAWTTVGEVCETCLGKMLDKSKNEGVLKPYLRNINVRWGVFDLTDLLNMPFKKEEIERFQINKGDLVVCEGGGEPGRCAIWNMEYSIMFQKALHRIRCSKGIFNEYIAFVLECYAGSNVLKKHFTGSTIKHLTGESLSSIILPIPPVEEQKRIVKSSKLLFAFIENIDKEQVNLKKIIQQAKSKILDLAIHDKLVPQDPNDEPATELLKHINPKAEITCDTPHYQKLPSGWVVTTIKELCENINGLWKGKKEPFVNVGVIRNANFTKNFQLDYSKIEYIDVEQRAFQPTSSQKWRFDC